MKKMKQVDSKEYNSEYYEECYGYTNFARKLTAKDFSEVYDRIAHLLPISSTDTVVDFGCGTGGLSIYLYIKFGCNVIGIDYSKDAIELSRKNLRTFAKWNNVKKGKITFINNNNNELPKLTNIKAVYLQDVVEHMYDEEIQFVLEKFKKWNKKELYLIVDTDNNIYLNICRPIFDAIGIVSKKISMSYIRERTMLENRRHINLTNPIIFRGKLAEQGFKTLQVEFAVVTMEKLKGQLRGLSEISFVLYGTYFLANVFSFLRPSFLLLAKITSSEE